MAAELLEIEPGARNVVGEAAAGRLRVMPLSVAQYHRMIDEGILADDTGIELLDGMLVPKDRGDASGNPMVVGDEHAYVVNQLMRLDRRLGERPAHIQVQQPITIAEAGGEPEPDAAIVLRPITALGKPAASDVCCVIEVAGTSLARDRSTKLRHYARGAIPQYIIIDLANRTAEEYRNPDPEGGVYRKQVIHDSGAMLRLLLTGSDRLEVALTDILPPSG